MPQLLEKKINKPSSFGRTITAQRNEILYREDIQTAFIYATIGITASLAIAGVVYVVGRKLIA